MPSSTLQLALAFAAIYLLWGSTYAAIHLGVQALPPALFLGLRFALAGCLMLLYARWRGLRFPSTARDWRHIAGIGLMLPFAATGLVVFGQQWVASGQAALIVATAALWQAWIGSWGEQGERLEGATVLGLAAGFAGVALLVSGALDSQRAPVWAYLALLLSALLWAAGSVWSRRTALRCAPSVNAGLQMLIAGIAATLLGLLLGEHARWEWNSAGVLSLMYLAVFGSCCAYGAYVWLVTRVSLAQLGTYAYINPAVAVLLGWWWLDERFDAVQVAGSVVILLGVVLTTLVARRNALIASAIDRGFPPVSGRLEESPR